MALIDSVWLYRSLPWLQHSTSTYYGSTSFYFTLTYSTLPYIGVLHSTIALLYSTWLLLYHCSIHDSTLLYHGCTSLYLTLHYSTSTTSLLHSAWLYIILPLLYFFPVIFSGPLGGGGFPPSPTQKKKKKIVCFLDILHIFSSHKSNFLPKTTSLEKTLLFSTGIYISLAWLYFTVLDSTILYVGSTSLHIIRDLPSYLTTLLYA